MKLIRLMTVVGVGLLTMSCYSMQPVSAAVPVTGTRLAFAINDVGRVALGGSMGPELLQVEGTLQSKDGDDYFVNVSGVQLLHGGFQTWAGENVRISSSYVSAVYEKKFSPGKTILASAVAAGAVLLVSSKGLPSFLDRDRTPDSSVETRRGRMLLPTRPGLPPFLRSLNPPRSY